MNTETEQKTRAKRGTKDRGTLQLLNGAKESADELLRALERAIQSSRQERFRQTKQAEAIQAILQQNLDVRGQIRRMWTAIPEEDRKKLEAAGYYGPRKDRT